MTMLDRLSSVLTPRIEGVVSLILICYGAFGPLLTVVVTDRLLVSLIPLTVLLTVLGLSHSGKRIWQAQTGKTGYVPKGTKSDYDHPGFVLQEALDFALLLCVWMTLGAILLYVIGTISA